jgi:2-polyprenyl-6-hydroxyphenyl methylase / 3-demethylubiquinone-9 3-methyltransferase
MSATFQNSHAKQNVDASEIAKFERMANGWWDPEGEFKPLHQMNPVRANYIDLHARVAEKKLLDVGCGGGLLSEAMAQRGAMVTGIDMGEGPLEIARLHALSSHLDIDYQQTPAEAFAEAHPQQFDVITCMEMLEHVPDPNSVIRACTAMLKPGGQLFFSTINRTLKAYAITVIGAEYILKWLPKGTHDYKSFIRPSELARWARQSGLLIDEVVGIRYHPFTQTFSIAPQDVDANYILRCTKPD